MIGEQHGQETDDRYVRRQICSFFIFTFYQQQALERIPRNDLPFRCSCLFPLAPRVRLYPHCCPVHSKTVVSGLPCFSLGLSPRGPGGPGGLHCTL